MKSKINFVLENCGGAVDTWSDNLQNIKFECSNFRAISQALFGTQDYHLLIRLKTALEIGLHPTYYDVDAQECVKLINDDRIPIPR